MIFFLLIFFQTGYVHRLVKGLLKGIDQLNLMQKKLTLFDVPFWKHSGKSVKVVHFCGRFCWLMIFIVLFSIGEP